MYRGAVRALLVAGDEILLVRLFVPDTGKHIWLAPGGGVEPDEDHEQALIREVWEETGHRPAPTDIQGPVWHRRHQFIFRGESFDQEEHFYFWPVSKFTATGEYNPAEHEALLLEELRWWRLRDIQDSDETFVPLTMGRHLEVLLRDVPELPIEVGI